MSPSSGRFGTAERRWAGIGPYYAMFPVSFADQVVEQYTPEGGTVLDPFAGRGTAIFSAAMKGRTGLGVELNPVGWVYSQVKLKPAPESAVLERIREIGQLAERSKSKSELPAFFEWCFSPAVRR